MGNSAVQVFAAHLRDAGIAWRLRQRIVRGGLLRRGDLIGVLGPNLHYFVEQMPVTRFLVEHMGRATVAPGRQVLPAPSRRLYLSRRLLAVSQC